MKQLAVLMMVCWSTVVLANESRMTRREYIDAWKDAAIENMVSHAIPASITLAQGILESGDGNSDLARKSNNHFGIKCHSDWTGKRVYHDDDAKGECFRKYKDARESYADHSEFLKRKRYESLFALDITDYKGWAHGLKKCGYATNPKYADRLIDIIEANGLTEYDMVGLALMTGTPLAQAPKTSAGRKSARAAAKRDASDDFAAVELNKRRTVNLSANRIKFTYGTEGDTFESLAEELGMMRWQIKKYNDFGKNHRIKDGEIIYLQPKRARAKERTHVVQEGESMWDVSQRYGVKTMRLYSRNDIAPGTPIEPGTELKLR